MEIHEELFLKSKKYLNVADHLAYITYPLVQDFKILVSITENINLALTNVMDSLIEYDILYKRISRNDSIFEIKYDIFKNVISKRYNLDKEDIELINIVRDIIKYHKESKVSFVRDNKLYICSPDFKTRNVTLEDIKEYLTKTKKLIKKLSLIYKM